jgi:metal-sulfur cluster biosynthetic enzyme
MHAPDAPAVPLPEALAEAALRRVIDPETALDIVALGLVYGIDVAGSQVRLRLTMTSAACPVSELIMEEASREVAQALPDMDVTVELCWDPPWTPERMSPSARAAMGWE